MTPKEVLEHEWYDGEKVFVVVAQYSTLFKPEDRKELSEKLFSKGVIQLPICVSEGRVKNIKRDGRPLEWEIITFDIDLALKGIKVDKSLLTYPSIHCSAFVTHYSSFDKFDHQKLCRFTFLTKEAAVKCFNDEVKKWNKAITVIKKIRDNEIENLKKKIKVLENVNNEYFDKFLIK